MGRLLRAVIIIQIAVAPLLASDEVERVEEPISALELTRLILAGDARDLTSPDSIDTSGERSHYDALGFPETADGQLVLRSETYGPQTLLRDESTPFLLYARYSNQQRDAVLLARTGLISDSRPDGDVFTLPYGFGAVRMNTVDISVVEGIVVPHVSDNRKTYTTFPLFDLYAGITAGSHGIGTSIRGVLRERYIAHLGASVSSARYYDDGRLLRSPVGSFSAGGGIRVPGVLPDLIGPNLISLGGELSVEVRRSNIGGGVGVAPGAYVELERVFFEQPAPGRDYRADPRPFNYRVHSVFARLDGRLDPEGLSAGDPIRFGISIGYRVNVLGPRIPEHEFKRTEVVYVADEFLEDTRRQMDRRDRRSQADSD